MLPDSGLTGSNDASCERNPREGKKRIFLQVPFSKSRTPSQCPQFYVEPANDLRVAGTERATSPRAWRSTTSSGESHAGPTPSPPIPNHLAKVIHTKPPKASRSESERGRLRSLAGVRARRRWRAGGKIPGEEEERAQKTGTGSAARIKKNKNKIKGKRKRKLGKLV